MNCDEFNCIANIDGECATDKCKGALKTLIDPRKKKNKVDCKKLYELLVTTFAEEFPTDESED